MMFECFDELNSGHHVMASEVGQQDFEHVVRELLDAAPRSPVDLLLREQGVANLDKLEQYLIKPGLPHSYTDDDGCERDITDEQYEDILALEPYFNWLRNGSVRDMFRQSQATYEMFIGAAFSIEGPIPLHATTVQSPKVQEY